MALNRFAFFDLSPSDQLLVVGRLMLALGGLALTFAEIMRSASSGELYQHSRGTSFHERSTDVRNYFS